MKNKITILTCLLIMAGSAVFSFVQLLRSIETNSLGNIMLFAFGLGVFSGITVCLLYVVAFSKSENKDAIRHVVRIGISVMTPVFPFYLAFFPVVSKNLWVSLICITLFGAWTVLYIIMKKQKARSKKETQ